MSEENKEKIVSQYKKLSLEEKRKLCLEWESSGLSKSEFCRQKGFKRTSFYRLYYQFFPEKKSKTSNFVAIYASSIKKEETKKSTIEIKFPNQVLVRLTLSLPEITYLLGELNNAATVIR